MPSNTHFDAYKAAFVDIDGPYCRSSTLAFSRVEQEHLSSQNLCASLGKSFAYPAIGYLFLGRASQGHISLFAAHTPVRSLVNGDASSSPFRHDELIIAKRYKDRQHRDVALRPSHFTSTRGMLVFKVPTFQEFVAEMDPKGLVRLLTANDIEQENLYLVQGMPVSPLILSFLMMTSEVAGHIRKLAYLHRSVKKWVEKHGFYRTKELVGQFLGVLCFLARHEMKLEKLDEQYLCDEERFYSVYSKVHDEVLASLKDLYAPRDDDPCPPFESVGQETPSTTPFELYHKAFTDIDGPFSGSSSAEFTRMEQTRLKTHDIGIYLGSVQNLKGIGHLFFCYGSSSIDIFVAHTPVRSSGVVDDASPLRPTDFLVTKTFKNGQHEYTVLDPAIFTHPDLMYKVSVPSFDVFVEATDLDSLLRKEDGERVRAYIGQGMPLSPLVLSFLLESCEIHGFFDKLKAFHGFVRKSKKKIGLERTKGQVGQFYGILFHLARYDEFVAPFPAVHLLHADEFGPGEKDIAVCKGVHDDIDANVERLYDKEHWERKLESKRAKQAKIDQLEALVKSMSPSPALERLKEDLKSLREENENLAAGIGKCGGQGKASPAA